MRLLYLLTDYTISRAYMYHRIEAKVITLNVSGTNPSYRLKYGCLLPKTIELIKEDWRNFHK